MSVIAIVSGKAAPGATTTTAALAWAWPHPVVLADCDPAGGDLMAGWLSQWVLSGWLRRDLGVLSFATATRHASRTDSAALHAHVQAVPPAPHVRLLAGLHQAAQATSVGETGWRHLAEALADPAGADALIDCGRLSAATPWPLLWNADVVLVAVRPLPRHVIAARAALATLRSQVESARLGLVVCAASHANHMLERALGVRVWAELPEDSGVATVFSDGADEPMRLAHSMFARSARAAARQLAAIESRSASGRSSGLARLPGEVTSHA